MIIAADKRQARVAKSYLSGIFATVPQLARAVVSDTAEAIELKSGVRLEIHTASFRSTRGYTVYGVIADELAYWRSDERYANPDSEILAALEPAMATVPGSMLWIASNPYARRGELYRLHQQSYGKDDPETLVWSTDTRTMNPSVPQRVVDRAFDEDPSRAASEYGRDGEISFRSDIEGFLLREVVEAAVIPGRFELPPGGER